MRENPEEWRPGDRVGDLTIVRRVAEGQGSFGAIHLVETTSRERRILKSLNSEHQLAEDWIQKFRGEIALHMRLSGHAAIVTCYGHFDAFGSPHLLMEYCPLGTLHQLVEATEGNVDVSLTASLLCDICEGLDAVHGAGFVYGDLNLLNVLIVDSGTRLRAKLTDFGVARPAEVASMVGTKLDPDTPGEKHSVAPEAYRGLRQPSNDVYAVGVLAFALATRDMPYSVDAEGLSPSALRSRFMELHVAADIPDPRAARPDLPSELTDLIADCLSKNPDDRPASVLGIRARLLPLTGA